MKTGITTHNLHSEYFRQQIYSMIKNNVPPDFIIVHHGGFVQRIFKTVRFLKKVITQYRFRSIDFIYERNKKKQESGTSGFQLSPDEVNEVKRFIESAWIIKSAGINDRSTISIIKHLGASIIACNSGILKNDALMIPDVIFLNVHASKLPAYRGMNNIEWALWESADVYVTIHKMTREIDEGDILYQEKINADGVKLNSIEMARGYYFFKSYQALGKAIYKFINHELTFLPQEHKGEPLMQYYTMHPILKSVLKKKLEEK